MLFDGPAILPAGATRVSQSPPNSVGQWRSGKISALTQGGVFVRSTQGGSDLILDQYTEKWPMWYHAAAPVDGPMQYHSATSPSRASHEAY
jgi:hypothetical protein